MGTLNFPPWSVAMSIPSNSNQINTAGGPDLSFGNLTPKNGMVIAQLSGGLSRALSDGSTITAGVAYAENKRFIVVTKHTPAGELDSDFGIWYTATTDFVTLVHLTIQPDAKPLLLAALGNEQTAFITRFNAHDGNVDQSFGIEGTRILGKRINSGLLPRGGLAVQADNNIVSVFHNGTDSFIYQLSSSGAQINFGNTDPIEAPNTRLNTLLITNSGFVIAGSRARKAHMLGLLHDGQLDSNFGNQGVVDLQFSNNENKQISALSKGPNGQIAVAGGSYYIPPEMNFVVSLLANGQTNPQFHGGKPLESSTDEDSYTGVVTQTDGKIVALARTLTGNLVKLIRHTLAGQLDPEFGNQGVAEAWGDPQGRPEQSFIDTLELVQPGEKLQSSGIISTARTSFIGRLLSQ